MEEGVEEGIALVGKDSAEEMLLKFDEEKMWLKEEVPLVGEEVVVGCDGGFGEVKAAPGVDIEVDNADER